MRFRVIQHELAQHTVVDRERYERQGADSFSEKDFAMSLQIAIEQDVWKHDGQSAGGTLGPGGLCRQGRLAFGRETTRSPEPDPAVLVEEEYRGALRAGGAQEAREGRIVNVLERAGLVQRGQQAVENPEPSDLGIPLGPLSCEAGHNCF